MKKIVIFAINAYQVVFSGILHQLFGVGNACRFTPTCSEYAKISVSKYGLAKGAYLSLIRLLKCQPFYSTSKI